MRMSNQKIRRQFANYALLSDSKELLASFCGCDIVALKVGLMGRHAKAVADGLVPEVPVSLERHGNGGFLQLSDRRSFSFYFDEFPSSIAIRQLDVPLDAPDFFERLYTQDTYVPPALKMHLMADMPGSESLIGKKIATISIYKHPDNHHGDKLRCVQLHEVAIGLKLADGVEYLLTGGFGKSRPDDMLFVTPSAVLASIEEEAPDRVWSTQEVVAGS